jgi:hypothetical protein
MEELVFENFENKWKNNSKKWRKELEIILNGTKELIYYEQDIINDLMKLGIYVYYDFGIEEELRKVVIFRLPPICNINKMFYDVNTNLNKIIKKICDLYDDVGIQIDG